MQVGSIDIQPVFDGTGREKARDVLKRPSVEDAWACHAHHLDNEGRLELVLGGFLIRTGDRQILVDAGAGTIQTDKYQGGALLDSLHSLGTTPEEITDVVFTHLHFDHVGWATKKGSVVFTNATYRVQQADWDHFVDSEDAIPGAQRKLEPLRERLEPFDVLTNIAPGVDARPAVGHTPGSTIYVVSDAGERALLIGDVAHSVVELTEPDWEAVFDVDPAAAQRIRQEVIDEVTDTATHIGAAHFPGMRFGRLLTVEGTRQWAYRNQPASRRSTTTEG